MRYFLAKRLPNGNFEVIGQYENVEDVITTISEHWITEWANGFIFVLENIPLKLVVN